MTFLDLDYWRQATVEDFALYLGLLALGALLILGIFFRVRLRTPKPPDHRPDDDHPHPLP